MQGFSRVEEKSGRARGIQRGCNLLGDNAALAHSGYDYPAATVPALDNQFHSPLKVLSHGSVEPGGKRIQSPGFNAHEFGWCARVH